MSSIEQFFIEHQFSYTSSKALPFVLLFCLGIIFWFLVKNWIRKRWIKFTGFLICSLFPISIYFALYPVYENDFTSEPKVIDWPKELEYLPDSSIVVATIPNCRFCAESIEQSNRMLQRNPKLDITYIVLAYRLEDLLTYKKKANPTISFRVANDHRTFLSLSNGVFPCFLKRQGKKGLLWSNNEMGVAALDVLEN